MLRAVNERDPNFIDEYKEIKKDYKKKKAEEQIKAQQRLSQPAKQYGRMLYGNENF